MKQLSLLEQSETEKLRVKMRDESNMTQKARMYRFVINEFAGKITTHELFDRCAAERPRILDPKRIIKFLEDDGLVVGEKWRD